MLFIALTRSGVLESLAPHSARQFPVAPGWYLTCATDDFVSRLAVSEDEIVESLLASLENRDHDVPFVTARFLRSLQILEIFKSTVSGRPAFFSTSSKGEFFLSTHVAWLRRAGLPIEEDPNVLPELLAYRVVGPPRTLFRGIRQLRLAGSLAVHIAGGDLQVKEHPVGYDPPDPAGSNAERDPAGKIANLLNISVARLMPAAPRVATLPVTAVTVERARAPDPSVLPGRYVPSTRRAREEFGLECRIPFDDALRRTWDWLQIENA